VGVGGGRQGRGEQNMGFAPHMGGRAGDVDPDAARGRARSGAQKAPACLNCGQMSQPCHLQSPLDRPRGINLVPLAEVPPALKLYPDGRESAYKLPYERAADLPMAVKDTE